MSARQSLGAIPPEATSRREVILDRRARGDCELLIKVSPAFLRRFRDECERRNLSLGELLTLSFDVLQSVNALFEACGTRRTRG